ncbi:sulfurtransferase TusA family protein [Acetobacter sp. DsW_063]|uniref:sulfurtransferase TusA family protein n=1 Tax=Acetobacter sp. DsW_063 TaxID=1514894 RepID=UPI000A3C59F8|nr:sulfurtransferase TusA family protein [Acetobacter sp. DsW_063]
MQAPENTTKPTPAATENYSRVGHVDRTLDITRDTCPMTFVRTRLALDTMSSGQLLAVTLRGEEPLRNVSRSASALGHAIISQRDETDGSGTLFIRKA